MGDKKYSEIKVDGMTLGITTNGEELRAESTSATSNGKMFNPDKNAENNISGISGEDFFIGTSTTSTTSSIFLGNTNEIKILDFKFKTTSDGNFIEVTKRQEPNTNVTFASWPPQEFKVRVWKEVYGLYEGALKLIKTIEGNVIPGHYVEEDISFDE